MAPAKTYEAHCRRERHDAVHLRPRPGRRGSQRLQRALRRRPPLYANGGTARSDWTVIRRDDGRTQWAYKGKPLYYWVKDQKPGDRTGDGFNGAWRVARP